MHFGGHSFQGKQRLNCIELLQLIADGPYGKLHFCAPDSASIK